jgi:hypothetical protein
MLLDQTNDIGQQLPFGSKGLWLFAIGCDFTTAAEARFTELLHRTRVISITQNE